MSGYLKMIWKSRWVYLTFTKS